MAGDTYHISKMYFAICENENRYRRLSSHISLYI